MLPASSRAHHELCLVYFQLKTGRPHPTGNVTKARTEFLKEVAITHTSECCLRTDAGPVRTSEQEQQYQQRRARTISAPALTPVALR